MLLPSRAATLWLWHCEAPKVNKMTHVVLRARGGKRDRMRDTVDVLKPSPNGKLLAFAVLRAGLCQITPLQPNLPSLCRGNFIQSQLVQRARLGVRLGSGTIGFCYQAHTYHAVRTFRPFRHKPEPICYHHTAACVVRFPHSLKHFVFCQSGAHFASPWQGQVYFLLGLNIFGSQMKETVPRESFRFHQIIREVVCAHAVKVLRDCFSLIKEAETDGAEQNAGPWMELTFWSFSLLFSVRLSW